MGNDSSRDLPEYYSYRGAALVEEDYRAMLSLEAEIGKPIPHLYDEGEISTSPPHEELQHLQLIKWEEEVDIPWDVYEEGLPWQGRGLNDDNFAFVTASGRVTGLALDHIRLESVPSAIFQLPCLHHLFLVGNQLRVIPDRIGGFADLEDLRVGRNPLAALPTTIANLKRLETLDIWDTKMLMIPPILLDFPQLKMVIIEAEIGGNDPVIAELRVRG